MPLWCHRRLATLHFLEITKLRFILSSFLLPNLICHKAALNFKYYLRKKSGGCGLIFLSRLK